MPSSSSRSPSSRAGRGAAARGRQPPAVRLVTRPVGVGVDRLGEQAVDAGAELLGDGIRVGIGRRLQRFADEDRDGGAAPQAETTVHGVDALAAPHRDRQQRHPAPRRDSSRPRAERPQLPRARDRPFGEDPDDLPGAGPGDGVAEGDRTVRAVDGDVAHGPHGTADDRWGEDAVLGEEPHEAAPPAPDEPDEEEVEETDVVAGEDGAALSREVLRAAHVDAQAEDREDREGGADDEAVGPVGHTSSSFPERARMASATLGGQTARPRSGTARRATRG